MLAAGVRATRASVTGERVANGAIAGSLVTIVGLFATSAVSIESFTFLRVVALGLVSFAVAGIVPPLVEGSDRRHPHSTDPQVL